MEELIEKVISSEATKSKWRNDFKSEEWQNATRLNKMLFGLHLNQVRGCECLEDLFISLKTNKKIRIMSEYKLKKGKVITSFLHGTITENSTDEEFANALKVNPAIAKHFITIPSKKKAVKVVEEAVEEVKDIEPEI